MSVVSCCPTKVGVGLTYVRIRMKNYYKITGLDIVYMFTFSGSPNCSESEKKKVMTEVHALSALDHTRIMRYNQSWAARVFNQEILISFEMKDYPT